MAVALDSLLSRKGSPPNYTRRRLASLAGLACVIGMDTLVPDIDDVFSLAGSLGLGLMAFTLPPAAFLGVRAAHTKPRTCGVAVAVVLTLVGLMLTFGSTSITIYGLATANQTAAPNNASSSALLSSLSVPASSSSSRWWW
jgi:hypothetical protein